MDAFPHVYAVQARAAQEGAVETTSEDKPVLLGAPPRQFGGPGDAWSPEDLLVAAVADCFILTFRAIAHASKLEWRSLKCAAEGTLDTLDGVTRFTRFSITAELELPEGVPADRAERLLHKAEAGCLITHSLNAEVVLQTEIVQV